MDSKTKEIQAWWDQNPFTLGVATGDYKKHDLVGRIEEKKMTLEFFEEIERRFRKHSGTGAQEKNAPLLNKLINFSLSGKEVLDIATGSGLFAVSFAQRGARVTAIDLTSFAVLETQTNLRLRNLPGKVLQMDAQRLGFNNESFDFVNAWGCLMHMPDTERAIGEIHRVLRPGGRTLSYMYNKSSWPFWFNIFFLRGLFLGGFLKYRTITRLTSRYSDGASIGGNMLTKFFTPLEAAKMFEKAGFSKVKVYPWDIGYEPNHWPMRKLPLFKYLPQKLKTYMAHHWGYGLIVEAQK